MTSTIAASPRRGRRPLAILAAAVAAVAVTGGAAAAATGPAAAVPAADPVRLTLPAPTGPAPVGTVSLHLVDRSRPDPWAGPGRYRELMISLWYPTHPGDHHPVAPWLTAGAGAAVLASEDIPPGKVVLPLTHGHEGSPVRRGHPLPVVLYSPGNDAIRSGNTVVVEQLASHGYLVVTIDHTYDGVVEFPDGRVVTPLPDGPHSTDIYQLRLADTRFVLDTLARLHAGRNPDAEHRPLPTGLAGGFDLHAIGMVGTSAGGATTASAMYADRRIKAGLSLDGPVLGPVVGAGLDRPYMLMEAKINRPDYPDLDAFWSRLRGWHLELRVTGAKHLSYSDYEALLPQLADVLGIDPADQIGSLDPTRGIAVQQAYPLAFFDRHLRHRGHLLDGPSAQYPEVMIVP
ncbi:alpha/beta hydrolase family protein [Actinoplanes sp. CA-051413]|uniref:alpha/beta hydrolase family protein n=1 Tax=Actinoplanes sp. CA-051413 TaxID=3239899 RepID=UPI003D95EF18